MIGGEDPEFYFDDLPGTVSQKELVSPNRSRGDPKGEPPKPPPLFLPPPPTPNSIREYRTAGRWRLGGWVGREGPAQGEG